MAKVIQFPKKPKPTAYRCRCGCKTVHMMTTGKLQCSDCKTPLPAVWRWDVSVAGGGV